jgi:hypothetical protein
MRCHECDHGFECCHSPSVRHADGTTECLGAVPCTLPHELHAWIVGCDEAGCGCEAPAWVELPLAA